MILWVKVGHLSLYQDLLSLYPAENDLPGDEEEPL